MGNEGSENPNKVRLKTCSKPNAKQHKTKYQAKVNNISKINTKSESRTILNKLTCLYTNAV